MNRVVKSAFFLSLSTLVGLQTPLMANLLGDYVVSDNPKPIDQRRSLGSGSRSNCQSQLSKGDVDLLVPQAKVVHNTSKKSPSLYFSSQIQQPISYIFTLVEPQSSQTLIEQERKLTKPGIEEIKLPEKLTLQEGKTYLWYVAFPCQNNPELYYDVLGAAIERIPLNEDEKMKLSIAQSTEEKAKIYASNGFWYEALKYALMPSSSIRYTQQLLESANLNL